MKHFAIAFVIIAALATSSLTFAAGGCGIGWHRGPGGGCYRNGAAIVVTHPVVVRPRANMIVIAPGRACPVGYHLGPHGRRCFLN